MLKTDGTLAATYYYDAFGNPVKDNTNENGINNPYRYAGYRYDSDTDLYYLNSRYYDSKIARFISEDTYTGDINDPLSLNLYTYCANNPIMYTDPTGHTYDAPVFLGSLPSTANLVTNTNYFITTSGVAVTKATTYKPAPTPKPTPKPVPAPTPKPAPKPTNTVINNVAKAVVKASINIINKGVNTGLQTRSPIGVLTGAVDQTNKELGLPSAIIAVKGAMNGVVNSIPGAEWTVQTIQYHINGGTYTDFEYLRQNDMTYGMSSDMARIIVSSLGAAENPGGASVSAVTTTGETFSVAGSGTRAASSVSIISNGGGSSSGGKSDSTKEKTDETVDRKPMDIIQSAQKAGKGNTGIGKGTYEEAWDAGWSWAGPNSKPIYNKDGDLIGLSSEDSLKAFRVDYKPKWNQYQANFQQNQRIFNSNKNCYEVIQVSNAHLTITNK